LIVGFPPGGSFDLVARTLQPRMSENLGRQVIVDNRPGANGIISMGMLARSEPDGYTIAIAHLGMMIINPAIQKVPYHPHNDFAPIGMIVTLQNIIITHPSVAAKDLKEFIALAKTKPNSINYATSGIGSPGHLAAVLFESMAKVEINHVPYKGGGPAMSDLIGGHVPVFVAGISTAVPHVLSGKARAIAVTGVKRAEALPNVPAIGEVISGFSATNWYGLLAPAKTPKAIVGRLNMDLTAALNAADVVKNLKDRGADATPSSPEEFTKFVRAEEKKWLPIIKKSNIKE
jgi:tripartite-type tricarboxylate transporter receptor subunit TctC